MLSVGGAVWARWHLPCARVRPCTLTSKNNAGCAEFRPSAISPSATLTNTCSHQQDRQKLITNSYLQSPAANCPRHPLVDFAAFKLADLPSTRPDNTTYSPSPNSHLSPPTSRTSRLLDPILSQGIGI
ncbi:hypothetical protein PMIN01_04863 [Paraphaeosphaeria minitans]|uniref:Uncharacterized protein n=1 Tax=Paraphaeosphaeria minitans TaxID=565426 RepID=A0A9P6GKI0_9PLEO|nr:hypothetical protein PMIN01_04863 [Paraphaeosphaeria minitans]